MRKLLIMVLILGTCLFAASVAQAKSGNQMADEVLSVPVEKNVQAYSAGNNTYQVSTVHEEIETLRADMRREIDRVKSSHKGEVKKVSDRLVIVEKEFKADGAVTKAQRTADEAKKEVARVDKNVNFLYTWLEKDFLPSYEELRKIGNDLNKTVAGRALITFNVFIISLIAFFVGICIFIWWRTRNK